MTNTIKAIDEENGVVTFDDDTCLTVDEFNTGWTKFLQNRIAGETLSYADMERFMRYRTSGKSLELLMKKKKSEGYLEGSGDKVLSTRQKIAIGTIIGIALAVGILVIILRQQGLIPV